MRTGWLTGTYSVSAPHPDRPESTMNDAHRGSRTTLRLVGGVLALAGAVIGVIGVVRFASEFGDAGADSGPGSILMLGGGGMMLVVGLALLNAGTIGAQSRYVADETAPAVGTVGRAFRGESQDSRSAEGPSRGAGPFCRECGVRNDADARFCDGCGSSLA